MNWTFADVESFLKENHFSLNHTRGSHYYYIGYEGGVMRQVCVPRHGHTTITPRTMKGIILQSGIDKEIWLGR